MTQTVLHVGPGHRRNGALLPAAFLAPGWREVRLDIDPANEPDIVGSMLDMREVADESMDAAYSAHNIEHVYPHEVPMMLKEIARVLKPEGFLVVTCPDLQAVAQLIAQDKLTEPAYLAPAGPVTPLDILYGWRPALAQGNVHMAHKCGFTLKVLIATLRTNGFGAVSGKRRSEAFDLWAVASRKDIGDHAIRQLAARFLPA